MTHEKLGGPKKGRVIHVGLMQYLKIELGERSTDALCKLVPCSQVYKVNAVMSVYLLESVTTVYDLNSK